MSIRLITFDFDNTLEFWTPAGKEAAHSLAQAVSDECAVSPEDFLREWKAAEHMFAHVGGSSEKFSRMLWITHIFHQLKVPIDVQRIERLSERYWDVVTDNVFLFRNSIRVLQRLRERHAVAILSDSDGTRQIKMRRICRLGVDRLVDHVFTTDETGWMKPDASNFRMVMDHFAVQPHECVMVGDNPKRDLQGAKQVGMTTVWTKEAAILSGERSVLDEHAEYVDFEVRDIGDVLSVVESIEARVAARTGLLFPSTNQHL
ncbi:MAG: HAD family hydrolase [Nanoarchaeota archaeon]